MKEKEDEIKLCDGLAVTEYLRDIYYDKTKGDKEFEEGLIKASLDITYLLMQKKEYRQMIDEYYADKANDKGSELLNFENINKFKELSAIFLAGDSNLKMIIKDLKDGELKKKLINIRKYQSMQLALTGLHALVMDGFIFTAGKK